MTVTRTKAIEKDFSSMTGLVILQRFWPVAINMQHRCVDISFLYSDRPFSPVSTSLLTFLQANNTSKAIVYSSKWTKVEHFEEKLGALFDRSNCMASIDIVNVTGPLSKQ